MKHKSTIVLTAFLILISLCTGQSQVTNGDRYNVNVWTDRFYFGNPESGWIPSFIMGIQLDDDDSPTHLLNSIGQGANGNSDIQYEAFNSDGFYNNEAINIFTLLDTPSSKFDFTVVSFNWYPNIFLGSVSTLYEPHLHDKNPGLYTTIQDITDEVPSIWYTRWHNGIATNGTVTELQDNSALRSVRLEMTWRHHHGDGPYETADRTGALTFGTLGAGDIKYHTNSNRRKPTGALSALGYKNQWISSSFVGITNSPDVTYSFAIDEASDVVISTDYVETNFDTRVHLFKADPTMNTNGELLQSSLDISNDNNKSALVQHLEPGEYWIVVEGDQSTTVGDFKLSVAVVSGFSDHELVISNAHLKPNGNFICPLSTVTLVSSPEPITYQWQTNSDGEWTNIYQGTDEFIAGVSSNHTFPLDVRRIMSSAGITVNSTTIRFDGVVGTSIINGKVTGPTTSGSQGIEGVWVYAVPTEAIIGRCSMEPDSAITNTNGDYTFKNIVSPDGATADYDIYPVYLDHEFTLDTIHDVTVGNGNNPTLQTFIDNTVLFISGKVEQDSGEEVCGLPNVAVSLAGLTTTTITDSLGNYKLPAQVGSFNVEAFYGNNTHVLSPALHEDIIVTTDVTGLDFESLTTHTISGIVAACGGESMGQVEIRIEDLHDPKCFEFYTISDMDGNFSIDVPGRDYLISITNNSTGLKPNFDAASISQFFSDSIIANVAVADTSYYLEYRQDPVVTIQAPTDSTGFQQIGSCTNELVLAQGEIATIVFEVFEENTMNCPLDTGILVVIDAISGLDTMIYPISHGIAEHVMRPMEPKLFPSEPVQQFEYFAYSIDSSRLSDTIVQDVIVTGYIPHNTTFSTVLPEIPIMILRDPPGDLSYAEVIQSETSETSLSFSSLKGGSVTAWSQAKVGVQFEAGFLGFSTESNAWGTIDNSLSIGASNSTDEELTLSLTNVSTLKTDATGNPNLIGASGDIFVGAAFNILYALADVLNFDEETCETNQTVDLIMGTDSIKTEYNYTDYFIRNSEIPRLKGLLNLVPADSIWWYEEQIKLWEQTLAINDSLKAIAINPTVVNFSGGIGGVGGETTMSTSMTSAYEFKIEIASEVAAEAGLEVAGSGASGGVRVNMRAEFGFGSGNKTLKSQTTGYYLQDDEEDNGFIIEVRECPQYNTPVFKEVASITSCPYIPGTSQMDKPELTVENPIRTNVDPNSGEEFVLTLRNRSELIDDENGLGKREYMIDIIDASNTSAAEIFPNLIGSGDLGPFELDIYDPNNPGANEIKQTVVISKNEFISTYSYENLKFVAYPKCESSANFLEETSSVAAISVFFNSPCSQVTLNDPSPNDSWLITTATADHLAITFTREAIGEMDSVQLEFKSVNSSSWQVGFTVDEFALAPGTSLTNDWDLTPVKDGEYDIRLKLYCDAGTVHSESSTGVIDRQGPIVFGIPSPIDDVYDISEDDVISIQYEEDIACQNASVQLEDMVSGELFDAILSCVNNQAIISPISLLPTAAYRVTLLGIEDVYANTTSEDYRWAFIVGDYQFDPNCDPIDITNNNVNQNAISQSVYYAEEINSTGTVANASTIGFVAEDQISLDSGFEVRVGATFRASIDDCPH